MAVSAVVVAAGGAFGGVSTGMSLASKRAQATRAVAFKDISSPVKESKPDVSLPMVRHPLCQPPTAGPSCQTTNESE